MLNITPLCLYTLFILEIRASTHWMVTENGLIQPRGDALFEMARPYDLLAFLNQDIRWDKIKHLYHDLKERNDIIKSLWKDLKRDTDVNAQLAIDSNCVKAGSLNTINWYTSVIEDGKTRNIPLEYFELIEPGDGESLEVPDCKKISSLTFSMHTFEHLEAMVHRQNLSTNSEISVPSEMSPFVAIDHFGHWIAGVLKKNSSSWLHYNMASLFWRIQGNAPKAMECSRRAVHYAPREHKDIPLLSMGTILHRCRMTENAITVLGAAFEHGPNYPNNNFMLANAFAVLGDFNSSINYFNRCLKLDPTFDSAKRHKYGVLCHKMLVEKLLLVQKLLTKLQDELNEYGQWEAHWMKTQASFLKTMNHDEPFDYTHVESNCEKMSQLTGLNIKMLKKEGDKNSLIQSFLDKPMYIAKLFSDRGVHAIDSAYDLQRLVQHIEKQSNMIFEYETEPDLLRAIEGKIRPEFFTSDLPEFPRGKTSNDEQARSSNRQSDKSKSSQRDDNYEYETGVPLYPNSIIVGRNIEDFDLDPDWPSPLFCKEGALRFPKASVLDKIYPVFLPFENKGIRLQTLLSDKIGVPLNVEHELPWHPPICLDEKDSSSFSSKKSQKSQILKEVDPAEYLRRTLLEYVGNGNVQSVEHMQDAEIGHRIYVAMQMRAAPRWVVCTLAALYWRVQARRSNALACLTLAARAAPVRYRDLVLASIASMHLEMGRFEDALAAAEEAFHLSLYEPATNFILAQMNMVKRHRNTQLYHLKQVVRVEPSFMGGFGRELLNAWGCIVKAEEELGYIEEGSCSDMDSGNSMSCERDGNNCRGTNSHCANNNNKMAEGGELLRMLKDGEHVSHMDEGMLESFVEDMTRLADRLDHRRNYDRMRSSLHALLKECGPDGCINLKSGDISLKEEDCTFQQLQLSYWLHIISFRQLINDAQLRLPPEIVTLNPSSKKIPECSVPIEASEDFFLERLSAIDVEGWQPLLSLMQQVAEMFDYFDYVTLGAKIARYVESHPRSWTGLLAAGWWCGAGGHAECCARCVSAAYAHAPPEHARAAFLTLAALTHMQGKLQDAKDISYLMFYLSPKSKLEAFLVAVSHTYVGEYEQAIWMYQYALSFDEQFVAAKACLHATMCLLFYGDSAKTKPKSNH